jgi:hypothetical protein
VRAELYQYRFTTWGELRREHAWWHRARIGMYVRPMTLQQTTAER